MSTTSLPLAAQAILTANALRNMHRIITRDRIPTGAQIPFQLREHADDLERAAQSLIQDRRHAKHLTLHIVTVNGEQWYHGPNAENALDHVTTAVRSGETAIGHSKQPWPKMLGHVKVQCCAGVEFHSSDCPVVKLLRGAWHIHSHGGSKRLGYKFGRSWATRHSGDKLESIRRFFRSQFPDIIEQPVKIRRRRDGDSIITEEIRRDCPALGSRHSYIQNANGTTIGVST